MIVLALGVGYLFGTIPSADLVARLATGGRVDIRGSGSGNPGALNAIHVVGVRWGFVVLALDIGKGVAAGVAGRAIGGDVGAYASATAAIGGHIAPVWTRFRGGKGVATSAGACLAVFPAYFPIDLAVALLGAVRKRRAETATRLACLAWVASAALWWAADLPNLWGPPPGPGLVVFALVGSAMILAAFTIARRRTDIAP